MSLTEYREKCSKCLGSGKFISFASGRVYGPCFTCKGTGFHSYKTAPDIRAKARVAAQERKARDQAETLDLYRAEYPAELAWLESSRDSFPFAQSLYEALLKYGSLTERQLAAVQSAIAKRDAAKQAHEDRITSAPIVTTDKLMEAFDKAKVSGLKRPVMRFDGFQASLAPVTGKNAGAVYLKAGEAYLGKIQNGKLLASRECTPEQSSSIQAAMCDPLASAIAYGRRTGACSICGRELTVKESIERGIGPICAEKFGF